MSIVKQVSLFEFDHDTGEATPLRSSTVIKGSELGGDWIVVYTKAFEELLDKGASFSALKLYIKLLAMQTYDEEIVVSKKWLRNELGLCKEAFYAALKWLKDENFVFEGEKLGQGTFILNPAHTAKGTKSLKRRKVMWSLKA